MSKVTDVRVVDGQEAAELPELSDELRVALTDIAGVAREGLLAMSVAVGLQVMAELMDDEVTATVVSRDSESCRVVYAESCRSSRGVMRVGGGHLLGLSGCGL